MEMIGAAALGRTAGTTLTVAWTWGKLAFLLAHLISSLPALPLAIMAAAMGASLGLTVALNFPEKAAVTAMLGLPLPDSTERFLRRRALMLGALLILLSVICLTRQPLSRPHIA